ncbi:hypothetical protein D9M68_585650 [compost metagenome]
MEVGHALRLVRHDQRALAQRVLRGDAGRAFAGMAGLGLDAADGEHEAARGVAPVRSHGHDAGHVEGGDDLARRAQLDAVAQVHADQRVVDQAQRLAQGRADVVDELHRRRAGSAFGAVDHDEVRRDAGFEHGLDDGEPLPGMAHAEFEAHRLAAGQLAQARHEFHQADGGVEGGVGGRRVAVLPGGDAARLGDLGRDLARGQDAAVPGLGALGQLDLDHLDLRRTGVLDEGLFRERAMLVAAAEIARADIPDQAAPGLAVIAADAALAGVVREVALARAFVQGQDGVGRQRAEAHRRYVEGRHGIGLRAVGAAHGDAEVGVVDARGRHGMVDPFVAVAVDVFLRAEGAFVDLALGALVDDGALRARERRRLRIVFEEVLADLGADEFEKEAQVAQDRIVAPDGVAGLDQVIHAQRAQERQRHSDPQPPGGACEGQGGGDRRARQGQQKSRIAAENPAHVHLRISGWSNHTPATGPRDGEA